jgi:macrolide transport system ATP-binding/permease protein
VNQQILHPIEIVTAVPLIELENIRKTYVTGGGIEVRALRNVSLKIYAGEFIAFMGASGSGKSTLMNIVGCLDRPTAGAYRFSGHDVSTLDSDSLAWLRREAFGFIFQSYNLLATSTAEENVEIPAVYAGLMSAERKKRADALLASLGLGDRLGHRPSQLSGGQQQRVCIARALINGGKIILADEPTGALDRKSGDEVMALLKDLADKGHTVILITHDAKVAAHANRVIEIQDGEVLKDTGQAHPGSHDLPVTFDLGPIEDARSPVPLLAGTSESLRMALRALRANVFRTVLTLLGIVIGVSSVVAMLAIGEGAKNSLIAQIGQMGTNLLVVRPQMRNGRGYSGAIVTLTATDAEEIAKLGYVGSAVPESTSNATVRFNDIDYQTQIDATTNALPPTRSWPVSQGQFFSGDDQVSYAAVAVLGQTVQSALFPGGIDAIGKYILINNVPFQVIGLMSPKGASANGNDSDDVIFVPLTTGMLRISGQRFVRSITVAVTDLTRMDAVQQAVTTLLTERHSGKEDFQIRNMADVIETATVAQNTMTVLLGSVAAISLIVGGIGVMNIMLVSVAERTREIGIRMATGARQRDILQQFLLEAVVVSGIGGVIGVLGGVTVGLVIRAFGTATTFTPAPMLLAFGCAAATGLVFGYFPARKAARLDPVVALASA